MKKKLFSYYQLTKPTIIVLVAITGITTMAAEGSLFEQPFEMLLVLMATIMSAGSANALNQFLDRDIDSIMDRTRKRRPLPMQDLDPINALVFAIALGVFANLYLWFYVNPVTAMISIGTILFYIFVYTLWLKRRHHYNIVIGGAAGATAPLIASAAYYGSPSFLAWMLFLLIFMWTPPHFWALALAIKDDYQSVKIPMLPNVKGDRRTRTEIWIYTWTLLPIAWIIYFTNDVSLAFAIFATLVWVWYLRQTMKRLKERTPQAYKKLFVVSILYLFIIFLGLGLDGLVGYYFL